MRRLRKFFREIELYPNDNDTGTGTGGAHARSTENSAGAGKDNRERVTDLYKQLAIEAFRFLGVQSFAEFDNLDMYQLNILREIHKLKQVDTQFYLHELAFLNFAATATDKKWKPIYKSLDKFFDYKRKLQEIETPTEKPKPNYTALKKYYSTGGG